jgi:hypothetical protein
LSPQSPIGPRRGDGIRRAAGRASPERPRPCGSRGGSAGR